MSSSVPVMFVPLYITNCYYLDGAIFVNCPINECIFDKKCCHDEILCFTNDKRDPLDLANEFYKENNYDTNIYQLDQDANFFEYMLYIIKTLFNKISIIETENLIVIKNTINVCLTEHLVDLKYWTYVFKTASEREYLIKLGELQGEKFINMLNSSHIDISSTIIQDISSTIIQDISSTIIQDVSSTIIQDVSSTIIQDISSTIIQDISSTIIQDVSNNILNN